MCLIMSSIPSPSPPLLSVHLVPCPLLQSVQLASARGGAIGRCAPPTECAQSQVGSSHSPSPRQTSVGRGSLAGKGQVGGRGRGGADWVRGGPGGEEREGKGGVDRGRARWGGEEGKDGVGRGRGRWGGERGGGWSGQGRAQVGRREREGKRGEVEDVNTHTHTDHSMYYIMYTL